MLSAKHFKEEKKRENPQSLAKIILLTWRNHKGELRKVINQVQEVTTSS